MQPTLTHVFRTPTPGRMVQLLGQVHPGVRTTGRQIVDHAHFWRAEAERALAGDEPALVALGDSIAQGIGASSPALGYVGLLAEHLQVPVLNLSRSGARLADVLDEQLPAMAESGVHPAAIVCTVGSNDLLRELRFSTTKRRMSRLIEALPDDAVLATLPDAGSMLAKLLNHHLRREAVGRGRVIADVATLLTSWKGLAASDQFHPNDAGHRLWCRAFLGPLGVGAMTNL